jgi:hypothetical protein
VGSRVTDWADSPGGWVSASGYRLYKGRLYHLLAREGVNGAPFWPIVLDKWVQRKGQWIIPPWKNQKLARRMLAAVAKDGLPTTKEDVEAGNLPSKRPPTLGPLFEGLT